MMHRIRYPKNKNIYLTLSAYKNYNPDDIIDMNYVENIICSDYYLTHYNLHNNIV
jgi:hypothetical protein